MATHLLDTLTQNECRFSVTDLDEPVALFSVGTCEAARALEKTTDSQNFYSDQRRHEVATHAKALHAIDAKGSTLTMLASIGVTSSEGRSVTDIDGVSFTSKSDGLWMLIVEAKDLSSGSMTAAKKQLTKRIDDMGLGSVLSHTEAVPWDDSAYIFAKLLDWDAL